MSHCSVEELRTGLTNATKETHSLWEENKDLQGRFVNDLNEISRIQQAIAQLEREHRQDQLQHARHSMTEMQRRASQLYSVLTTKREEIVKKLNDGTNFVALLQNQLISDRLFDWKNRQKLAQVGVPFDNRDVTLDEIQMEFEFLAEQNWQLHMFASWTLDLLTRVQPEPVLKTQHKFVTEVRLLIGDKLGIRQHLVNTNVTVKIIAEEEAKLLSATQMNHKDIKTVGSISNDYEKMTMDERGHMAAKFNNSKLTRIAHRKPPPKGTTADMKCTVSAQAATDQKYALLFHISPFQLGTLGKFDVWTLSLPLMVTVHGSQDCDAQGAIVWHRAFASVSRSPGTTDITAVAWKDLGHVLRHKFTLFTGARRPLSDADLNYLSEKLLVPNVPDQKPITFHRFAKQNLRDDVSFSFWEWFFAIMQLIKQKLLKFWDEGWLVGFISKHDASQSMMMSSHSTFLLRFSDTQTGAVSIGFVCEDDDGQKVPFHLAPFSIKDLDQLSLAQRIASCPQLKEIKRGSAML
ncbi:STAT protein, DNA binding domain protein [Teladorsagia circumcincta]|uniref:STAT protein, DNA binding domain protein n=1 Tax=Teladorsagia circumcincta TaxID=45464 RepID=A0A2G9ULS7_TELCI|nr:STAT protein, DNA binding domain protein [Teladorsagia circumcincta]